MFQFLESICAVNGKILNLKYHQKRVDKTFKKYFKNTKPFILFDVLNNCSIPKEKTKIRITYSENKYQISTTKYLEKKIEKVKIVVDDNIKYNFKFSSREEINKHVDNNNNYDDIIIIQNNLVTDSSYANLLFFDGNSWFTPKNPLLNGTKREKLIANKIIEEKKILVNDIHSYPYFMQINAMLDFDDKRKISTKNISF